MSIYNILIEKFEKQLKSYNNIDYKPCVVFDIDGTILVDGNYAPESNDDIIQDVYNFLLYLQRKNIDIFIITARPDNPTNRRGTDKMLQNLNINYVYLYMWDDYDHITYKELARKDIHEHDYNIIMSLGDNYWDYGKYGGLGVHIYDDGDYIKFIYDFL